MSPEVGTRRSTKAAVLVLSAVAAVVAAVATVSLFVWKSGPDQPGTAGAPDREATTATAPAKTSSVTAIALPDGPVQVLGVEVLQPVADAGVVPLNTAVQREWQLRNTGTTPITLGRTSIEVLEGC
ncbi:MAG: hypothetical protein C0506_08390 [Anaerolinea sp.]|nr:hypothetical protein [Anaerolinea sp.]